VPSTWLSWHQPVQPAAVIINPNGPDLNPQESRPKLAERYWNTQLGDLDGGGPSAGFVEPVVDVRWISRKLPKAMYQRLYFFPPEKKTPSNRAELEACGKDWKGRIHVTLFVKDWNFAVSNNKLVRVVCGWIGGWSIRV
jgi:hypothetical protein